MYPCAGREPWRSRNTVIWRKDEAVFASVCVLVSIGYIRVSVESHGGEIIQRYGGEMAQHVPRCVRLYHFNVLVYALASIRCIRVSVESHGGQEIQRYGGEMAQCVPRCVCLCSFDVFLCR